MADIRSFSQFVEQHMNRRVQKTMDDILSDKFTYHSYTDNSDVTKIILMSGTVFMLTLIFCLLFVWLVVKFLKANFYIKEVRNHPLFVKKLNYDIIFLYIT